MGGFLGTGSGKAFIAGLILIITGALAQAYECPWGEGIIITGVVMSILGLVIYLMTHKRVDTGN